MVYHFIQGSITFYYNLSNLMLQLSLAWWGETPQAGLCVLLTDSFHSLSTSWLSAQDLVLSCLSSAGSHFSPRASGPFSGEWHWSHDVGAVYVSTKRCTNVCGGVHIYVYRRTYPTYTYLMLKSFPRSLCIENHALNQHLQFPPFSYL